MNMPIKPKEKTILYVSKADLPEGIKVDATTTQIIAQGELSAGWKATVAEGGEYRMGVCLAAPQGAEIILSAGAAVIKHNVRGTKGYLSDSKLNFERFELPDTISLEEGETVMTVRVKSEPDAFVSLTWIDLHPKAMEKELRDEEAQARAEGKGAAKALDRYAQKSYGMMFHWTAQSCPRSGERKSYEQAVSDFDTERFAEQVKTAGASYVFLTANHAIRHFPAPLTAWEAYFPGYTTKRDLVADLYHSLKKRDIDLMLYLNFTAAYLDAPFSGIQPDKNGHYHHTDLSMSKMDHYTQLCVDLFNAIGERYGDKVKGYWIDSCYQLDQQFNGFDFKPLYKAAKKGNPDRMVGFNFWIMPVTTPWNDYWAGETARYADIPDHIRPSYGPANGTLFHELIIVEDDWGHFSNDRPIPEPFYSAEDISSFAKKARETGAMLTINAEVYQDGTMSDKSLEMMKKAKSLLES